MQQSTNSNSSQTVFNNQYTVHKKISSGSFGVVFLGFDQASKEYVAIKVEKEENEEVKSLEREVAVLNRLKGVDGIPKMYWSGEEKDHNILVIQLLGKDLAHYVKTTKKFSLKTVLLLSDQMIQVLERMHIKGVLHRDLKPENILLGKDDECAKLYLVDFGISKIYRDIANRHISFKDNKPFIGTTRYASIAAHKGYELGRKDDLESMIYVLMFFLKGQLPWQNMQNVTDDERTIKVGEMKMKIDLSELCKDIPNEFILILEYLKKLTFKSEPDYKFIQQKFQEAAEANNIQYDQIYDWSEVSTQLKKTVTLQDNENKRFSSQNLAAVDKMKFSHQNSNMGQSSVNYLVPPDPRNNLLGIQDQRSISRQGSVLLGTHNSMAPKYQPSMAISFVEDNQIDVGISQSQEKVLVPQKSMIENNNQPHSPVKKSTTMINAQKSSAQQEIQAFLDCDIDENFGDQSLNHKYGKLRTNEVHACLKDLKRKKPYQKKQL